MGFVAGRYTAKAPGEAGLTVSKTLNHWRFCWRNRTEIWHPAVTKT
jgi:hypothetical protein